MRKTTFLALLAATAVVVAAAVISRIGGPTTLAARESIQLFPGLADDVNRVAMIKIESTEETLTIEKTDDGWRIAEKHGYPARLEKVKEALIGLLDARAIEAKTRDPERYHRLEVDDLDAPGSKAHLVTVVDQDGAVLARLLIGKWQYRRGGVRERSHYVRKPGEAQSWLAQGNLDIPIEAIFWMSRPLLEIPRERIRSVTVTPADAPALAISKSSPSDEYFSVMGLAPDADIKRYQLDRLAGSLAALEFGDVMPADSLSLSMPSWGRAVFQTFDGLVVEMALTGDGEYVWATLASRADPDTDGGTGSDESDEVGVRPDVAREAEEINARVGGWAYRLPTPAAEQLLMRIEDVVRSSGEG